MYQEEVPSYTRVHFHLRFTSNVTRNFYGFLFPVLQSVSMALIAWLVLLRFSNRVLKATSSFVDWHYEFVW